MTLQGGIWRTKGAIATLIIAASTITMAVAASITLIPTAPCAKVQGSVRVFTIVADLNGYNGTRSPGGVGPFMTVQACDTVVLNFANRDVQAHGLSVEFYAVNGVQAVGGTNPSLQFVAFKPGDFKVYCNTLCSVHNYMQNAKLTVSCCSTGCC